MPSSILKQIDSANFLTLTGLILSFFSAIMAIQGNFYMAIICMMYAGILDLFDGLVARRIQRTELQAHTGKQLDSLVDICSFGFSPAIFAYCFGMTDFFSLTLLAIYLGFTASRLAYFNSTGLLIEGSEQYFIGLPVTYAALFIPLAFTTVFVWPHSIVKLLIGGVYFLLSLAMIADFKMIKLRGIWYGIFTAIALTLTGVYGWAIAFNL